jgi:hypothetical protein
MVRIWQSGHEVESLSQLERNLITRKSGVLDPELRNQFDIAQIEMM